jgi:hypothetical protein
VGLSWQGQARELLREAGRVLVIGAKHFGHPGATQLEDLRALQALPRGPYDGIVWRVRAELRSGLEQLKPLLTPGAPLLLLAEARRPPQALLRSLLGGQGWPLYELEELCEGLLLRGLSEPRLLAASKAGCAVAARNPQRRSALDAFFEQPAS